MVTEVTLLVKGDVDLPKLNVTHVSFAYLFFYILPIIYLPCVCGIVILFFLFEYDWLEPSGF